ncbi:MAG: hypothetical protein AAFU65_17695, partial [Pseudomonadota bacterium]
RPDVLNLSLTGRRDRVLDELVDVLLARGTLIVAAYDETRSSDQRFPVRRPGVIYAFGVSDDRAAAVRRDDVVYGPLHALSLTPMAGYDLVTGHSVATPHLTAMAARLFGVRSDATREHVIADLSEWIDRYYGRESAALDPD